MSKSTVAVILTSPARLAPWGDDAWRFTGAMQVVADGPDWLHAQWTVPGEASDAETSRFVSMVLRDEPADRAEDIAVMALALSGIPEWRSFDQWWFDVNERPALRAKLDQVLRDYSSQLKLAIIETSPRHVLNGVSEALVALGFEVVRFAELP